ncbi:calcium/sodium antiporter [Gordonia sp. zg691]|uniref:calcium/sodium antiporter n=1 Tax=Gordonia jinghuaiqii TaxID=2758710 RepID=UPI0016623114|nr:calcium/sodium antiporter [Gordonia jinghuaiqii]MBD0863202.1 calcium/sodium antiporter [Gordonia jinghuaiqii]
MVTDVLLVLLGLGGLVAGAELLVRGGSAIASELGVSPLLVGLTIVSIGTSMPELAVGIDASFNDAGALAIGNIAGTNIVNLLLILGLSAAMVPLALGRQTIRLDLPVMVISALLLLALSANGTLTRLDGLLLLTLAAAYTAIAIRAELKAKTTSLVTDDELPATGGPMWQRVLELIGGIAVVVVGADLLVRGSVDVATDLGVSEAFIGLTIVAIGTSAPELTTTIMSTLRGNRDLAIGNLIGSSVYNIAFILGVTALVKPLDVTDELIRIDIPLMAAVALLCIPVFISGRRISRPEGLAFVAGYFLYLGLLIAFRG